MRKRLIAIDLFCGAGGLTQGLKKAGFSVIAGVDNNKHALNSYRKNNRRSKAIFEDISMLDPCDLMNRIGISAGQLDLLAGCPPCQGFSRLTTRNKQSEFADIRNQLVFEIVRFSKYIRPRAILMENVPGLKSDFRFRQMVSELQREGYFIDFAVQNAADFGVPQIRKRLIMVGSREHAICVPKAPKIRTTVRHAIGMLPVPGRSGDPMHDISEIRSESVMAIIRSIPKDGGSRDSIPPHLQLNCHRDFVGHHDVYGRLRWDTQSVTITSGFTHPSKGRFLHPDQDRSITPREAALLQGFPPQYHFATQGGKSVVAQVIGNSFPPPMAQFQARHIRTQLRIREQGQ